MLLVGEEENFSGGQHPNHATNHGGHNNFILEGAPTHAFKFKGKVDGEHVTGLLDLDAT